MDPEELYAEVLKGTVPTQRWHQEYLDEVDRNKRKPDVPKKSKKTPKTTLEWAVHNKKIYNNVVWNKKRIDSKLKSASVKTSKTTVHVYESEELCVFYYIRSLLSQICQGVKVRNLDVEDIGEPYKNLQPLASKLIKHLDPSTVTWKRVTLNIQHHDMSEILAYIYQFLLRPDVIPESLMLIHPAHVFHLFGVIALRNCYYIELKKVLKDMGSPVLGCHILLIADSLIKTGSLIRFNTSEVEGFTKDIATLASHRKTLLHLSSAAVESRRCNRHAGSTKTLISAPFNKGTAYTTTTRLEDAARQSMED
jgi:hypothetical protein